MMRAPVYVVLGLALCAAVVPVPAAPIVREVIVEHRGEGDLDADLVLSHSSVTAGEELDRTKISHDVRALLDTGLFSAVDVMIDPDDDGVRVIYAVAARPRLARMPSVSGVEHFRPGKVLEWVDLHRGDLVDEQVLGVRVQRVVEEYRKDFYPDAAVSWTIDPVPAKPGFATVTLTVQEGERGRTKRIRFRGNDHVKGSVLRKATRQPVPWNLFRWIWKPRYDEDVIQAAAVAVRDVYLDRGYLDVRLDAPTPEPDDGGNVMLYFNVREGEPYRFGDVSVEGITLFPESALQPQVMTRSGDVASMGLVRLTAQGLQDYYGSRGYIDTRVTPTLTPRAGERTADVVYRVREGELVTVGNIRIRGNTRTRDKVIRRELLVYPGDVYNDVKARRSERRLSNLGYFSSVRRDALQTSTPHERDLVFEVEEKRTGQFMVGAGFSSVENVIGYVELSQGNFDLKGWPTFTGGGQKLKTRAQIGSNREDYEISFVEPWFLNRKLALGVDLFRNEYSYTDYAVERTGAAVSLTKGLPGANRVSFRYRIEKVSVEDEADTNRYFYVEEYADFPDEAYTFVSETDRVQSSFRVTLTHDTRDNPFIATRGMRLVGFYDVSGGPFGFDTDLYHVGLHGNQYIPLWFGHVLSLKARYEVVEAFGNADEVPISDRLFAGGGRSLRGFDYRDVGPKVVLEEHRDDADPFYRPVGGRSLAIANAEYTIPVVEGIRLAAFYDTGMVWRDSFALDTGDFAATAGVGIRLDMPGFPIRIDRGWPVHRNDPLTDEDPWVIWIGYDY